MPDLARSRSATLEMWRADAQARPQGAWRDLGAAQAHTTGLAVQQWNGLLLRAAPPDPERLLAEAAAWFGARSLPYGVLVPAELDVDLPGCRWELDHPVMLRRTDGPLPPVVLPVGVTLSTVAPPELVAVVQAEAFALPYDLVLAFVAPVHDAPFRRTVLLLEGGEPVATACLALTASGAGVYDVAVRPRAQGRGLGSAVSAWCLGQAARAEAGLVHLSPSAAGHGMYARLGFTDAAPWRVLVPEEG